GKFPVNVNAVENAACRDSGSDVAIDEQINAGRNEFQAPCIGRSGCGEPVGTSQGDEHLEYGMQLLQLLDGREVSVERPRVRLADGWQIRRLVVRPRISDEASRAVHPSEGIIQVGQAVGDAVRLQVCNVEIREVDAPLLEVSADNFAAVVF